MNLRCRKPRPLVRDEETHRDARLIVIATEDTHAPTQYFSIFRNPRIQVKVLPTDAGRSAPEHVLARLADYAAEFQLGDDDQLWLLLDTDHWIEPSHIDSYRTVCAEALQKGYRLAHSNPCFDLWLLLHHAELTPADQLACFREVEERLRSILGSYNKARLNLEQFPLESVPIAIERAERLDAAPNDRWPQKTGTHLYRLAGVLIGLRPAGA